MRISFINSTLGGDYSALDIAITSLATYLNERSEHNANIIDFTFHRRHWKTHLLKKMRELKPDIIGFSTNDLYMEHTKKIARFIKQNFEIPIIAGGYYASIHSAEAINIPYFDYVLVGDGEYSLTALLTAIEKHESIDINGVLYKEGGEIKGNAAGSFIHNLNALPAPNYDLWEDLDKYFYFLGMLYMIGTRGCPFNCTYCDALQIKPVVRGNYYRIIDPAYYVEQIAANWNKYKSRGLRFIQMFDQVFTLDVKWLSQFIDEYVKRGLNKELGWSVFARIDQLDEDRIKLLAKGNCKLVRVGIEAGDDFIRNEVYEKHLSKKQILDTFALLRKYGVGATAYYILGGPGETRKTIEETISLAREVAASRSAFFIYKPFTEKGTRLMQKYGGYIDQKRLKKADNITFDAVVHLKDIGPREIEWLQKKAYFFTFGKRLLKMLKRLKFMYFAQLAIYIMRGLYHGLDLYYLILYYQIYGYDNVDK